MTTFDGRIQSVELATGRTRVIPFGAPVALGIGPELRAPWRVEQGPVRARLVQSPRISPDGARVAFSVLTKVYTMDLAGGEPRRLTSGDAWEFKPAWSPDGRWLAYVTWSTDGGGVPVKKITDIGSDYFGWSDDGRSIYWALGSTIFRRPFDSIDFRDTDDDEEETERSGEPGPDEPEQPAAPVDATGADAAEDAAPAAEAGDEEPSEEEPKRPLDEHESVQRTEIVLEFPRATPRGAIVLRGGTVITMEGDDVIRDADIIVVDNRIRGVGPRGATEIPAGAQVFDITGRTVVPGFIDTHAHWEFRTQNVLELHNWSLLANLAYGVTTGLEVQTSTNDYLAYQDLVETVSRWGSGPS